MSDILIIPRIKVHNANALSSPYTIGFPAMTAWLGAVHALQRILQTKLEENVKFSKVGVVCHEINLHTYQGQGDYVQSIIGTGNPLSKEGKRPSFIEEARCDLTVSLIIECQDLPLIDEDPFTQLIDHLLLSNMKMAGGDIIKVNPTKFIEIDDGNLNELIPKIMPGFCLIERKDLMQQYMAQTPNALDALLNALTLHYKCEQDESQKVHWQTKGVRQQKGWIIPISVGYQGISSLAIANQQRDVTTPHRFAESIVTLGEFKMPHKLSTLNDMLWEYHVDLENNLYLCQQQKES